MILPAMSETEIIQGCIRNEPGAQKMLYKKYKTFMLSACLKYVRNKYEAEDILQESLIAIFRSIGNFKGDCSFKSWLYKVAQNKAITHYNREKRESMHHIAIEDYITVEKGRFSFEDKFIASDQLWKAMRVLAKAAPKQHTCFRLYYIEGLDHKEIAEDIDISESTSKSNCSRATEKLKEILIELNTIPQVYKVTA